MSRAHFRLHVQLEITRFLLSTVIQRSKLSVPGEMTGLRELLWMVCYDDSLDVLLPCATERRSPLHLVL